MVTYEDVFVSRFLEIRTTYISINAMLTLYGVTVGVISYIFQGYITKEHTKCLQI